MSFVAISVEGPREFSRFRQAIIYVEDASAARPLGDCAGLRRAVSWNKKGSLVMPFTNRRAFSACEWPDRARPEELTYPVFQALRHASWSLNDVITSGLPDDPLIIAEAV